MAQIPITGDKSAKYDAFVFYYFIKKENFTSSKLK